MLMATGAWSTSALLLLLLRRFMYCAAWRVNKEAPSANSHERRLPIRRAPRVLVGEGRVATGTA
jgi:hypothetical protein